MISVLKSVFYYIQKSQHIFIQFKNHSPDLAKEYSKNLISEFLVYIHSADRHRYSINIYWIEYHLQLWKLHHPKILNHSFFQFSMNNEHRNNAWPLAGLILADLYFIYFLLLRQPRNNSPIHTQVDQGLSEASFPFLIFLDLESTLLLGGLEILQVPISGHSISMRREEGKEREVMGGKGEGKGRGEKKKEEGKEGGMKGGTEDS